MEGLKQHKRFVAAKLIPKLDASGNHDSKPCGALRWDKVPIDVEGKPLQWTNPDNLMTYDQAMSLVATLNILQPNIKHALGYIFSPDDGYVFIDLDQCYDGTTWSLLSLDILNRFPMAWREVSSSGTGLHIVFKGNSDTKAKCKSSDGKVEFYPGMKFMMFGYMGEQGITEVDYTDALPDFISTYLSDIAASREPIDHINIPGALSDPDDIIAMLSKCGLTPFDIDNGHTNEFHRLWNAKPGDFEDESVADAALAERILWASGNNLQLTHDMMLKSGLYREKYERPDYLPRTILAISTKMTSFYSSTRGKNTAKVSTSQYLGVVPLTKRDYPELMENFKPANSVGNLKHLLKYYGITCRWNDMSHIREVHIPGYIPHKGDAENCNLWTIIGLCSYNNLSTTHIDEHLDVVAHENPYHPIAEYVLSKPWDGVPRLDQFISTLRTTNDAASHPLVKTWMIATIAAPFSVDGFSQQGILVLEGAQGIYKTRWVKALDPTQSDAIKEGMILDLNSKDCVITALSHWIVEMGELDGTIRRTEMARIKSFSTSKSDVVRFPFARKNTFIPRRTSFVASVNETRFLTDTTGNRRWWVVSVESIDLDHALDMQQVWAEAYALWLEGAKTWLDKSEIEALDAINTEYSVVDPFEERLLKHFDWSKGWQQKDTLEMTATEVLKSLGFNLNSGRSDSTRMAVVLKKHALRSRRRNHYLLPQYAIID